MSPVKTEPTAIQYDEKLNVNDNGDHVELAGLPSSGIVPPTKFQSTRVVSKYSTLTQNQTLRTFKFPVIYSVLAAFNAANDGYCYSIPGKAWEVLRSISLDGRLISTKAMSLLCKGSSTSSVSTSRVSRPSTPPISQIGVSNTVSATLLFFFSVHP